LRPPFGHLFSQLSGASCTQFGKERPMILVNKFVIDFRYIVLHFKSRATQGQCGLNLSF